LATLTAGLVVAIAATGSAWLARWVGSLWSPTPTWPQRLPFLGGGVPDTHAWSRYHARYYPMTLVFIVFEMEMMFMYPWAVVFVREGGKAMIEMGMFLGLLSLGLAYAWREGVFRWQ
jgi:NADH-quinone oxidoreductase subunit A